MPSARRLHLSATGAALLLPLALVATAPPADGATKLTAVAQTSGNSQTTTTYNTTAENSSRTKPESDDGAEDKASEGSNSEGRDGAKPKGKGGSGGKAGTAREMGRANPMTWQSNESQSKDRAIYHCARQGRIVGRAYVVNRADAIRFRCRYDKQSDKPYGVMVFQPAGRRVVVKVGLKVVQDYDPPSVGRDVWVVKGNPTGWWRTFIT